MFNLGFTEILLLGILALIFIGPKQLPEIARTLGRVLNELKRAQNDITSTFTAEMRPPPPVVRTPAQQESPPPAVEQPSENPHYAHQDVQQTPQPEEVAVTPAQETDDTKRTT